MRSSAFLVWGGGGHGKVVADVVRACGHDLVGFVDADPGKSGRTVEPGGAVVIFSEQDFLEVVRSEGRYPTGIGAVALAVGDNGTRAACLGSLGELPLPPLVHPTASVSPSARLGRGTVLMPGAIVNAAADVGAAVILNSGAIVEHDCRIGDGAHLSSGAVLAGGVQVGERSWVGAGATVIQGVRIGRNVIVGAGAVVLRDVADGTIVAGVPARALKTTDAGD